MKFLVFAVFSFLLSVHQVWSLECWHADYEGCRNREKLEQIYDCVKFKQNAFTRAECKRDQCVLATATFADETIELRFCKIQNQDCVYLKQFAQKFKTGTKSVLKDIQCSSCNSPLCNDPHYKEKSKNGSGTQNHKEAKPKNDSGIQNYKFSNTFILGTIVLIIFTVF